MTEDSAGRSGIKRPAQAVLRSNASFGVDMSAPLWKRDRDATRKSHVALVVQQTLACLADCNERSGTGGRHTDARPTKIQLVSNAGRQEVFIIPHKRPEFADLIIPCQFVDERAIVAQVRQKIGIETA